MQSKNRRRTALRRGIASAAAIGLGALGVAHFASAADHTDAPAVLDEPAADANGNTVIARCTFVAAGFVHA